MEGLETDVCLTRDGQLVLLHDPLLTLGTTLEGWAHETPAEKIRSALIRDAAGTPTAEHPLLLEELIEPLGLSGRAWVGSRSSTSYSLTDSSECFGTPD